MTAPLTPITDEIIDQIASADDQHIATDFFRRLCNQAKEANSLREDAERYRWLKSLHPLANVAVTDLNDKPLCVFGVPMLDAAIDAARKETP